MRGITSFPVISEEDLSASEAAQNTTNESGSVALAESALSIPESPLVLQEPAASVRNMQGDDNQPRTGECFVLTTFRTGNNSVSPGSIPLDLSSSLRTFFPYRGSEGSEHSQQIRMSVIHKTTIPEEESRIAMETDKLGTLGAVNERAVQEENQEARKMSGLDAEDLQPVESHNLQAPVNNRASLRLTHKNAQTLSLDYPHARPSVKILGNRKSETLFQYQHSTFTRTLLSLHFTDKLQNNPLYERVTAQHCANVNLADQSNRLKNSSCTRKLLSLQFTDQDKLQNNPLYERVVAQHCPSLKPTDQSNPLIPQRKTHHGQQHGCQNGRCTTILYHNATNQSSLPWSSAGTGESPYARVLCHPSWELSRDHLSLFERIGGGSFGQVWKGAVLDVAGAQGWSIVAVKMLKENSSSSDLKDLLSELDLLKKLKPHPNVIQLLGCLTEDVIRLKGGREFKSPLVILEFVPHGDLLGYLKKSKGETDDYYNMRGAKVPQKIPTKQLYKFALDIARGMEFISAHQLVHRDLAARNVLVGEGLRCKITDFGMARDLGRNEIYVRKSNGRMPVKWMAVESLTSHLFTTESDVWSYGIVLYEIFTLGGTPYEGMTGEEVYNYVATGHRLPRTSAMSSELYNLMLQCWHEEPSKRPTFGSIASWTETLAQDQ